MKKGKIAKLLRCLVHLIYFKMASNGRDRPRGKPRMMIPISRLMGLAQGLEFDNARMLALVIYDRIWLIAAYASCRFSVDFEIKLLMVNRS